MQPVSLKELLEAGCHFGHKTERWHPKAKQFIYQARDGIHIIDLAKTKAGLEAAAEVVKNAAARGEKVLFVGTKRQAQGVVKEEAERVGAPYLTERWIGGFLTNWDEIHKNLEKIRTLESDKAAGNWKVFPKHEQVKLDRHLKRLKIFYGGVVALYEPPKIVVLADVRKEKLAFYEAKKQGIPTIAIVDTNCDPSVVTYPIPANDDAVGSIKCIMKHLVDAYLEGHTEYEKEHAKEEKSASAKASVDKETKKEESKEEVKKVEKVKEEKKKEEKKKKTK